MTTYRKFAVAVLAAFSAGAIGYGVASAAPGGPPVPAPQGAPHQVLPAAGNGNSPRPPARPDSVYVPVKDCRIVNTSAAGGKIPNGGTRSFYVVGSAGFTAQGGQSGGCGIPVTATAISARVSSVSASGNGSFAVYPTGTPDGYGTLYYAKGVNVTTGATLQLGPGTGKVLTARNTLGPAHLVINVNGYYDEQIGGMITPSGTVYSGSNHIVSASVVSTGVYRVTLDRDVSYCTPMVDTYSGRGVYGSAYAFAGTSVYVYTWYISSSTHLEVANNYYFYLTVTC
jgi:hypothetical protein